MVPRKKQSSHEKRLTSPEKDTVKQSSDHLPMQHDRIRHSSFHQQRRLPKHGTNSILPILHHQRNARLILIDDGSKNKGDLLNLCNILKLDHHTVSPESHDGILNERFHRYLNKAQKIGAADMRTFEEWAMNAMFATYAWNASPVDGTDIQRAFAAVSKHFNFPMDATAQSITEPPLKKRKRNTAQETIDKIETMFPLWWSQKELLKQLIEERRQHHLQMKNKNRTQRTFNIGDLVMVRKQVQSKAIEGIPAKLVLKTKGPYRVLNKQSEDSYLLQKIPGTQTMTRTRGSVPIKEQAFRMTKIPSTLIIH